LSATSISRSPSLTVSLFIGTSKQQFITAAARLLLFSEGTTDGFACCLASGVRSRTTRQHERLAAMSSPTHPIAIRSVAIAALMGATFLATPLVAIADPLQLAQNAPVPQSAAANPAAANGETVEQRITSLHAALKITPDEESRWNAVAQAMRENAANMEKLVAEKRTTPPQNMTAVDDLTTYQQFAQAHVDGLKNLNSAFKSLYSSMPDPQKKIADEYFSNFGRENAPNRG
jgi:hypothetical protein